MKVHIMREKSTMFDTWKRIFLTLVITLGLFDSSYGIDIDDMPIMTFQLETDRKRVFFTPEGNQFATAHKYDIILRDLASGTEILRFEAVEHIEDKSGSIGDIAFSNDGRYIASVSLQNLGIVNYTTDEFLRLWDRKTGTLIYTIAPGQGSLRFVRFSPDSSIVAIGASTRNVLIYETESGRFLKNFDAYLTDGPTIDSITKDGWWPYLQSMTFSPDGIRTLSCHQDFVARLWDIETGEKLANYGIPYTVPKFAFFSSDGKSIIISVINSLYFWDIESGENTKIVELPMQEHTYFSVPTVSPNNRMLFVSIPYDPITEEEDTTKNFAVLFDVETGEILRAYEFPNPVRSASFSPDNRYLLTATADSTAQLWDIGDLMQTNVNKWESYR